MTSYIPVTQIDYLNDLNHQSAAASCENLNTYNHQDLLLKNLNTYKNHQYSAAGAHKSHILKAIPNAVMTSNIGTNVSTASHVPNVNENMNSVPETGTVPVVSAVSSTNVEAELAKRRARVAQALAVLHEAIKAQALFNKILEEGKK